MRWLALMLGFGLATAAADEPLHLIPVDQLAAGFRSPGPGDWVVRAWANGNQTWSARVEGSTLVLEIAEVEGEKAPRWADAGPVAFNPGRVAIQIEAGVAWPGALAITRADDRRHERAWELVRGRLDTTAPTEDLRRAATRSNKEGANFAPPRDPAAWASRAEDLREQLAVTLGTWPDWDKTPLNPRVFGKVDRDGYTIEKVVLETFPGFFLGGNLYRPTNATGRRPGVLTPHGHYEEGRVAEDMQNLCVNLARMGNVAFLYDMVGYNDSRKFGHSFLNPRRRAWGLSLATLQTWNSRRALDWLLTLPDVDPARIACTGSSGGGTQTFFLTALDPRVRVAAPVVMVSEGFQGGCSCENAAGLRHGTDNVEIAALAAPRPLLMVAATGDWTVNTPTRVLPPIREVYRLLGKPENVAAELYDFPHNYNQTSREAVNRFFLEKLWGDSDAAKATEAARTLETAENLWAFSPNEPTGKSPDELEADLIRTRREVIARSFDDPSPFLVGLRHRLDAEPPSADVVIGQELRRVVQEDGFYVVRHWRVGRSGAGDRVAVVSWEPPDFPRSGRALVLATPRGKAALIDADGGPAPLVRELLGHGFAVIGYDELFAGESFDPTARAGERASVVHFDCYNPTLAQERARDLATVIGWARSRPEVRSVSLAARGEPAVLAALARPLLGDLARTFLDLEGFDYGDGSGRIPPALDVPGVLQFGGLPAALALSAPWPIWIEQPGSPELARWATAAFARQDAAAMLRFSEGDAEAAAVADWLDRGMEP